MMMTLFPAIMLLHQLIKDFLRLHSKEDLSSENSELKIVYMSSNFVVINKNYDCVINTNVPEKYPVTVQTQLKSKFPHLANSELTHEFHFCHRLDFSTSGLLCIALNKKASSLATKAFSQRKVDKYYLALVRGHLSKNAVIVKTAIGSDNRSGSEHKMCGEDKAYCANPRQAESRIIVLQIGIYDGFPATKIMLKSLTGRRHQLRVHCNYLGHTIVGDYTYSNSKDTLPHRMFLHAYKIVMPTTLECVSVVTEDPFSESRVLNRSWYPVQSVYDLSFPSVFKLFDDAHLFS
ncbi:RNA pseudouridylate synthase domain-containing protein 1 [Nymphon striatum]|nr:RNA pseudouridylate synthase domain-containing protein 1 [Nymphon striatum]